VRDIVIDVFYIKGCNYCARRLFVNGARQSERTKSLVLTSSSITTYRRRNRGGLATLIVATRWSRLYFRKPFVYIRRPYTWNSTTVGPKSELRDAAFRLPTEIGRRRHARADWALFRQYIPWTPNCERIDNNGLRGRTRPNWNCSRNRAF